MPLEKVRNLSQANFRLEIQELKTRTYDLEHLLKQKDEQYIEIIRRKDAEISRLMTVKAQVDLRELEQLRLDYRNSQELCQKYSTEFVAAETQLKKLESQLVEKTI